ncbi:MAG: methionyl-tRNA formyltransferase [Chloroflexi bacterium]|nr:methionyl-tRNA formyltransferase [Chloroflexota bacterium]
MADDFRIALIGQAAFGESVLNALVEHDENIVGVFCPPDREGRPADPIKTAAEGHDIPVLQFRRMRNQDCIDAFLALNADLCVMAFVTDIVPDAILEAPTQGTIQYHPSLLPLHRGPSSINWPIIFGREKTGLTVFWPDKGLDTGPVLLQKETEIGPDDTLGSVYFGRLFPMGVDAMVEAVDMVKAGTAPRIEQNHDDATYEGWCRAEDVVIDWDKPVGEVYNLIRGSDPSPGSGSTFGDDSVRFFRASKSDSDAGGAPGEVTEITDDGFRIAANGGSIFVGRVQQGRQRKVNAPEWIEAVGLKVGDRFGD